MTHNTLSQGLSADKISPLLTDQFGTIELLVFQTIASTNDFLKQHQHPSPVLCIADSQTHGKGQRGKDWVSPPGQNITLSLQLNMPPSKQPLPPIALVCGLSLCEYINSVILKDQRCQVKWPNDIVIDIIGPERRTRHKLAGILIETHKHQDQSINIIISICLKVNTDHSPNASIAQPWTSLSSLTQKKHNRHQLIAEISNAIIKSFYRYIHHGFDCFLKQWPAYDYFYHRPLTIQTETGSYVEGIGHGIDRNGRLVIKDKSGREHTFSSGSIQCNNH